MKHTLSMLAIATAFTSEAVASDTPLVDAVVTDALTNVDRDAAHNIGMHFAAMTVCDLYGVSFAPVLVRMKVIANETHWFDSITDDTWDAYLKGRVAFEDLSDDTYTSCAMMINTYPDLYFD